MKVLKIVLIALSFTGIFVVLYKIVTKNESLVSAPQVEITPVPTPMPSIVPSPQNNAVEETEMSILTPVASITPMPSASPTPLPTGKVNRVRREIEGDDD